jgi:ribose transport system substrate-binding protein
MADEITRDEAPSTDARLSRAGLIKAGAVTAAGLAGAGLVGSPSRIALGAPVRATKRYKIAIVPKALNNPVFNTANWGGATRAKELGNVDFKFTGSVQSDAAVQATVVDGLISAGYDAIGISCNAPQPLLDPINKAVAKGIVVMTWDSDSPQSKRAVFYGVDSYQAGIIEGQWMNKLLAGKSGNIWILSGSSAAQNLNRRIDGVKSVLSKSLKIKGYSYCDDDIPKSVTEVENVMRANPDLIGYIMVGAWPLFTSEGATPTLKARAKAGLQVVAFDYLAQELPFLAHGTVKVLVGQDYWGWGYQSVQIMYELLKGHHYPAFVPQAIPVVTTANLAKYQRIWATAKDAASAAKVFKEAPIMPST